MTKPGRIPCCVPFCRRTAKDTGEKGQEIICAKHWRLANKELTTRYKKAQRKLAPRMEADPDILPPDVVKDIINDWRWLQVLWREIKAQAIERAMGI